MLSRIEPEIGQRAGIIETPLGSMLAVDQPDGALLRLEFTDDPARHKHKVAHHAEWNEGRFDKLREQLSAYFTGSRCEFDLPLAPQGTDFQRRVWTELTLIPYGTTTSYGELARRLRLGPESARAVGSANGANPIAVVIPCHRVIGANGALTGYAYGLDYKRRLLELEGALLFA